MKQSWTGVVVAVILSVFCVSGPSMAADAAAAKAKAEAKAKQLSWMSTDPQVVAAVKAYNANPPAEAKAMTQEKWKALPVLDPFVRGLSKNALAEHLKGKRDGSWSELFVSGADGTKAALLNKTSSWSHKGKEKHDVPMQGKTWIGEVEVDASAGVEQIQIGLPVLDGGKAIGSIVVGLSVSKLN
jgi:hypothetical protein